jgi:hypothetical protein
LVGDSVVVLLGPIDEGAEVASSEVMDGSRVGRPIGGKLLVEGSPLRAGLLAFELHAPRPHTVAEITLISISVTNTPTRIKNHKGFLGGSLGGLCFDGGGDTLG